ncbi:hypothetical protein HDE_04515 [Halotydeus destructor]|nr:hypothetical protein HDE_04515 [Halotydeus destructor]
MFRKLDCAGIPLSNVVSVTIPDKNSIGLRGPLKDGAYFTTSFRLPPPLNLEINFTCEDKGKFRIFCHEELPWYIFVSLKVIKGDKVVNAEVKVADRALVSWSPIEVTPELTDGDGGVEYKLTFKIDEKRKPVIRGYEEQMRSTFKAGVCADVSLVVGDKTIMASKMVLMTHSKYFRALFERPWSDGTKQNLVFRDIDHNTMSNLIEAMYVGHAAIHNAEHALELFELADRFGVDMIKGQASAFLGQNVTRSTVLLVLIEGEARNCKDLKDVALQYIADNKDIDITSLRNYSRLDGSLQTLIIKALCQGRERGTKRKNSG